MTTNEAVQNLDGLMANTRMTRQDHIGMSKSLEHLKVKALLLDGQEAGAKEAAEDGLEKEAAEVEAPPEADKEPETEGAE